MFPELREEDISRLLAASYQPGWIAATDGLSDADQRSGVRCAAVLVPLIRWQDVWQLVFTRRTQAVEHHKGQVSFPGGGCEVGESAPEETAIREAGEEIGLQPADVHLLGRLNDVLTISHFRVSPVVGVMPWPYPIRLEKVEVARVFTIPLPWLADSGNREEQPVRLGDTLRPFPLVTYHPYNGETLWGVSARITLNFLSVLGV
jgi:8-oxo-dGTP pyrophosphatase MutT (NUDIX family)